MRRKYDSEGRIPDSDVRRRSRKNTRQRDPITKASLHTETSSDIQCLRQDTLPVTYTDVCAFICLHFNRY